MDQNTTSASESALSYPRTDAGNAELFADMFRDRLRHDRNRDRWFRWAEHWWVPATFGQVEQDALEAARRRKELARTLGSDYEKQAELQWSLQSESAGKLAACIRIACGLPHLSTKASAWDNNLWLLGVRNGVLDLRTGALRNGEPADHVTMRAGTTYDPTAECPSWTQFLRDIFQGDEALVRYYHKAVGYSLTGDTSEQVWFLCHGTGANGKSTFLEVLRAMLGDYGQNAPFSMLEMRRNDGANEDVARLVGRRFVTANEANEGARLNEARMRALTGGDTLTARVLYGHYFDFEPVCKLWVAVNHLPTAEDRSHAFWRRVRLIPFNRTFTEADRDPGMRDKLLAELPGILRWAVEGCRLWGQEGLGIPRVIQARTQAYRDAMDSLAGFTEECCRLGPEHSARAGELRKAYETWCETAGHSPLGAKAWVAALQNMPGVNRRRSKLGMTWEGIALQADAEAQFAEENEGECEAG